MPQSHFDVNMYSYTCTYDNGAIYRVDCHENLQLTVVNKNFKKQRPKQTLCPPVNENH